MRDPTEADFYREVREAVKGRGDRGRLYKQLRERLSRRLGSSLKLQKQLHELNKAIEQVEADVKRAEKGHRPTAGSKLPKLPPPLNDWKILTPNATPTSKGLEEKPRVDWILEEKRQESTPRQRRKKDKLTEKQQKREKERRRKILANAPSRAELADVASPQPTLSIDGLLHAGPNNPYDVPRGDDDLATLPIRQRALISTLLSDLPNNAPRYLRSALTSYDDELKNRGAQPILGLLKDMASIIEAGIQSFETEGDWLADGMRTAFSLFVENHVLFIKHFPLDPKREDIYARTPVDEDIATGSELTHPFQEVARAASEARTAGLATNDFTRIVSAMAEFSKIISTLPPASRKTAEVVVRPEDRMSIGEPISSRKRILLSGIGFFERVYNLVGTSAQLAGPPEGNALLVALRGAIASLSQFIIGK
jgi:hypothetical protein